MDDRTQEQKTADNQLENAINAVSRAYEYIDEGELITTWICCGSAISFDGDGSGNDSFFILTPNQHQSAFQSIGLLRYGQAIVENAAMTGSFEVLEDGEENEDG